MTTPGCQCVHTVDVSTNETPGRRMCTDCDAVTATCAADCGQPATYGFYCSEDCQDRHMATFAEPAEPVDMFGYTRVDLDDGTVRFEPEAPTARCRHCGRPLSAQSVSPWWCGEDCQREAAAATALNPAEVETGLTMDQHRAVIAEFLTRQYG